MIIVMSHAATKAEIDAVVERVEEIGLKAELSRGEERTLVGVIGGNAYAYKDAFSHLGGIQEIIPITKPFKLASREFRRADTVVDVGGVKIGGDEVVVMAGPCSVEGEEMLLETARHVASQGARMLRGGAFKPRTSPYSFQGLGESALKMMAAARTETGLKVVTDVARGDRRRRQRVDHRGPPDAEPGAVGRRAIARLRRLRPSDGGRAAAARRDAEAAGLAQRADRRDRWPWPHGLLLRACVEEGPARDHHRRERPQPARRAEGSRSRHSRHGEHRPERGRDGRRDRGRGAGERAARAVRAAGPQGRWQT